jgi:uncharacterized membrane protein
MAQTMSFRDLQVESGDVVIHEIGLRDLVQALREGWDDYNAMPSSGVFLTIIYPLFALLLTLYLFNENLVYLAFPMIAGCTLIGPVVCLGLFEMSRRREQGLELQWRRAFDFVHSYAFAPIIALTVLMTLLYLVWLLLAEMIWFGQFGTDTPATFGAFVNELFTTRRGAALILYGCGVGFIFAFLAFAFSVVSFPLVLDKPVTSGTAISVSARAVYTNPGTMAVWGLIVVALLTAGAALFLIGLAVVLPVLGHATWHLYRKVVAH